MRRIFLPGVALLIAVVSIYRSAASHRSSREVASVPDTASKIKDQTAAVKPSADRQETSATRVEPNSSVSANPPAKTADETQKPANLNQFVERLIQLDQCMEGGCDYPETDPHSYDFALNHDIARNLKRFAEFARGEKIEHDPRVSEVARAHLDSANGFVQEAALKLIATQDPSPENLDAILEGIVGGSDPDLIQAGFAELSRYPSPGDRAKIDVALTSALTNGAPFVAEQISLQIRPLLNSGNVGQYRGAAEQMPSESIYRGNLEAALSAFVHDDSN